MRGEWSPATAVQPLRWRGFQGLAWVHEGLRRPRRRSYGIAGSGGAQRCDLLPQEVENAGTTPGQPGIVSETLSYEQVIL